MKKLLLLLLAAFFVLATNIQAESASVSVKQNIESSNKVNSHIRVETSVNGVTKVLEMQNGKVTQNTTGESIQEKIKDKKQEIEEKRREVRERIQAIKNERKRQVLEKIDENIQAINSKWVLRWNSVLDRLESILGKMEVRADKLEDAGYDMTEAKEKIAEADTLISEARSVISQQEAKLYLLEIGTEENLGESVSAEIAVLREDLQIARESVFAVREKMVEALRLLKAASERSTSEIEN